MITEAGFSAQGGTHLRACDWRSTGGREGGGGRGPLHEGSEEPRQDSGGATVRRRGENGQWRKMHVSHRAASRVQIRVEALKL